MDPTMLASLFQFAGMQPQQAGPMLDQMGVPAPGQGAQGMQGAKKPDPITPIMSGGVSGGVKAPEAQKMQTGSPAIQSLMSALLSRGAGPQVPQLGDLIRNVRPGG